MLGGVHGSDEWAVYAELSETVEEWIRLQEAEGRPLPRSTSLCEIEALVSRINVPRAVRDSNASSIHDAGRKSRLSRFISVNRTVTER